MISYNYSEVRSTSITSESESRYFLYKKLFLPGKITSLKNSE